MMRAWHVLFTVGLVYWLMACGATNPPPPSRVERTPVGATLVAPSDAFQEPTRQPVPTPDAVPDASQPIVLTLWVPEDFATGAERGGDILDSQIAEFAGSHPNISLNYVLKAPYGKGGILDWITQLDELMPDKLPDAAIVDSRELNRLEKLGLLQPLQRGLPSGAYWDLFPPAQRIARRSGQWNNQPLTLETEHLVYDTRRVAVPPLSWQTVVSETTPFAFAADSTEAFLFQYLENGGSLDLFAHRVADTNAMQAILDYYQRLRATGTLAENASVMQSAREVIPLFVSGQVPIAQVRSRDYLIERSRLPNALTAPIPTRDGRATALVSSWSFVVLTPDAVKGRAATEYLGWIIDPARMGAWASAAKMVPASKSAFAQAIDGPGYPEVLWSLLQDAIVAPGFTQQAPYAEAWHTAVKAVMTGQLAPDDAAFRAVQAITQ